MKVFHICNGKFCFINISLFLLGARVPNYFINLFLKCLQLHNLGYEEIDALEPAEGMMEKAKLLDIYKNYLLIPFDDNVSSVADGRPYDLKLQDLLKINTS